jgi:hypothetical protein
MPRIHEKNNKNLSETNNNSKKHDFIMKMMYITYNNDLNLIARSAMGAVTQSWIPY